MHMRIQLRGDVNRYFRAMFANPRPVQFVSVLLVFLHTAHSTLKQQKNWWRGWDSNPRYPKRTLVFETNQYTVNILLILMLFTVLHTLLHSHTAIVQDFVGSGGGCGIRTHGTQRVQQFSRLPHSTTLATLRRRFYRHSHMLSRIRIQPLGSM